MIGSKCCVSATPNPTPVTLPPPMRLYSGLSTDFIRDTVHNRIADKLKDAFLGDALRAGKPVHSRTSQ